MFWSRRDGRGFLGHRTLLGRAVRLPLRLLGQGRVVRILSGPCRGARWVIGAGPHACWFGWYERPTQLEIARVLRPGDVAYDIGANVGFFTLLMARRVGPTGHVHAFEPAPDNAARLRRVLALNGITHVTVHEQAVGDRTREARFDLGRNYAMGHLSTAGTLVVPVVAMDDLELPPPRLIKIDIEAGECAALYGMRRTLLQHRPYLLVEPHLPENFDQGRADVGAHADLARCVVPV